ncbi:MAG: glutaredoxin domain-containing protein [Bacteroidales bacterium]
MHINSFNELQTALKEHKNLFLLLYKSGSGQSDCALQNIRIAEKAAGREVLLADVNNVRDIHPQYGVNSAPSMLEFTGGKLKNVIKGCQTEEYYRSTLSGTGFSIQPAGDEKPAKRVTVYTTPTCTWCNTIKTYFREKKINFTEVNVASDPARAEEMAKKSGQQGVPQTDINGKMVIGFDKNRINELLEIR